MPTATFEGDPLDAPDERTSELDVAMMARAVWARKLRVLVPAVLALIASAVIVQLIPPEYKSTASILLQSQESSFTRPLSEQQQTPDQQAIDDQAVGSQVQLLKSRDIARQAVRQLSLVGNPEFDPLAAGIGPIKQALMSIGLLRNPFADTPEDRVLDAYFNALTVYPMDKSRVLTIEFASRDPDLAARAANTIADIYIAMQRSAKRGESQGASDALSPQIEVLRSKVATAEAAVEAYRTKNGLFVAQNNASLSTQQLSDITAQLSAAQSQQTEALAKADLIRDMIRDGRPVEVSDVSNNETVRRLVEQRAGLLGQLALEQQTLLPGHPRIKELKAQLAALESQIGAQAQKTVRTLENDASLAKARVQSLSSQLDRQKSASGNFNENEVQLRALEREAKAQRDLLESYLSRFREASARASFQELPADARIISRAVPASEPYFPKKLPIITISTLSALILSLAFLVTGELLSGRALVPAGARRRDAPLAQAAAAASQAGLADTGPRPAMEDRPAASARAPAPSAVAGPPEAVSAYGSSLRGGASGGPSAARVEAVVRAARAGNTASERPTPWPGGQTDEPCLAATRRADAGRAPGCRGDRDRAGGRTRTGITGAGPRGGEDGVIGHHARDRARPDRSCRPVPQANRPGPLLRLHGQRGATGNIDGRERSRAGAQRRARCASCSSTSGPVPSPVPAKSASAIFWLARHPSPISSSATASHPCI